MSRLRLAIVVLVFTAGAEAAGGTTLPPGFSETVVTSDLFLPTGFTFTPDRRILILEKGGVIKVVHGGTTTVAGSIAVSAQYDETGLLGITVDPDFASNGYIYVYYTTSPASYQPPGHSYRFAWNRVSRFTMSGNSVSSDSEMVILDDIFADTEDAANPITRHGDPHTGHHNGGCVLFGPDGKLYISVGDAANGENAQNLAVLNGKILRLNPDGSVPGDNPFVQTPGARPEIWCLGLRNPWRFTFDALGRMFIGDVGLDQFEEINLGGPGLNFGWPFYEGTANDPRYIDPIYAYPNDHHNTAIAAVGALTGSGIYPPKYSNVIFFGDFGQGFIYTLSYDVANGATVEQFATKAGSPVHFAQGPDGHMYYLSIIPPALRRIDFGQGLVLIQLASTGGGMITTEPEGIGCGEGCYAFPPGQVVTLQPVAISGHAFAGWTGNAVCPDARVTIVAGLSCVAIFQPIAASPATSHHRVDLSGDGTGDAFFYDVGSGDWSKAFSAGDGRFNFLNGRWSPQWSIAPGDFNGNTLTDLFLYNSVTGQWVTALNTSSGGFTYASGSFSPGWRVRSGRFDLDAIDDVFVYNPTSGLAVECLSDGAGGFARFAAASLVSNMDPYLLDANGDGLKDVLLYGATTGQWVLYINDGSGGLISRSGSWPSNATITVGDFDGNGLDDVFLYSPVTGQWVTALNVGNGQFQTHAGTWSPSWVVSRARLRSGVEDDLFLYNPSTGQWFQCFTDGAGDFGRYVNGSWSPGWQVFPTDLNGDGVDDILLYDVATGLYFQCLTAWTGGFSSTTRGSTRSGFTVIATR
ncbi:MAG: PQQ-dependent sugar dehydrogenase [Acidobacteria bacterium]|nr:PQQ-dependent sugar dehydrogenase [Acidobacteriota bacterium]